MNISKKISVICEEAFVESIWCKKLLSGLVKELKKRRISYEQLFDAKTMIGGETVCIIGFSDSWTEAVISRCNALGCVPVVLSNQSGRTVSGNYHLVCPALYGSMNVLKRALKAAGRTKIALYAANRIIDLDRNRTEVFSGIIGDESDIYSNKDHLENCFRSFYPKASLYDAVVCVNGYAAISLVKKLEKEDKELLKDLVIVAFEEVLKHSKYNQYISFVKMKLDSYGAVAMQILDMAAQNGHAAEITVKMECVVGEIARKEIKEIPQNAAVPYFEDPEIIYMGKIEQLMQDADDMDHHIIAMMLDGATYADIADSCYMTEGNIKYRVKKYLNICDCKTKKELLELLREYLQ